ncbi:MAG TPA: hypothetical protein VNT26_17095 [Candidatus Sulfotelmatobacter sp.]|nr:hypothetical protein [Candidatus Sulfotelmatobacter sp.]HWI58352.1 hypothetical protein [Bacillota bacterium]
MEIEFNPSRVPKPGYSEPVPRRDAPPAAPAAEPLPSTAALEEKTKSLPLVRPEKVLQVKPLASHLKYPPDEMLDRIAALLATHYIP